MRLSLNVKVIIVITLTIFIVYLAGVYFVTKNMSKRLRNSMTENSIHITHVFYQQLNEIYSNIQKTQKQLQASTEHAGDFKGVMYVEIYDRDAKVIAHTQKELVGKAPEDKLNPEFVIKILDSGETLVMEHPDEGRYEMFVPVLGTNKLNKGQKVGVIDLAMVYKPGMELSHLKDHATHIIQSLQLSVNDSYSNFEAGKIYMQDLIVHLAEIEGVDHVEIYDKNGVIIAHTNEERVGGKASSEHDSAITEILIEGNTIEQEDPVRNRFSRFIPIMTAANGGGEQISGVAEIVMDMGIIDRKVANFNKIMFKIAIVLALTLLGVITFAMRKLVIKPIERLSEHAKLVAGGDLTQKVAIGEDDEFGDLAKSFNAMTTGLRKSNEDLLSSKYYIESILKSMNDALMVISPDGTIRTVNTAACAMLGYEEAELLNQLINKVIPDEQMPMKELEISGYIVNDEKTYLTKSGREIPISFSASVMQDSNGNIEGCIFVARDITKHKQAEEKLRESEEKYRSLYDSNLLGVAITTYEGKIRSANKTFQDILGFTESELQSMSIKDITHPDDIEENMKLFNDTVKRKLKQYGMEKRYFHKNGRILWCDLEVFAIYDEHGDFRYCFSMIRDITERKMAEEALRQTLKDREILYRAIEATRVGITICDNERNIIYVNEADASMHGYTVEELTGKSTSIYKNDVIFQNMLSEIEPMDGWTRESTNVRMDGSEFPVLLSSVFIKDDEGRPTAMVTACTDITERKQAEEEKQRQFIDLEKADKSIKASLMEKEALLREVHHRVKNNMA
ncbi:hypothetical protein LCGC14_1804500, partial [marine sediment metagenome]